MEETDKDWIMMRMVGGWVFLLVPAHPGSTGQRAVKRLSLLFWHQKTTVPGVSCGIVYMILHLSLSVEHWWQMDGWTGRRRQLIPALADVAQVKTNDSNQGKDSLLKQWRKKTGKMPTTVGSWAFAVV